MSEETKTRFTSRKLWVTIVVGVVVSFGKHFGVDLDEQQLYSLVGLAGLYNVGNGIAKGK